MDIRAIINDGVKVKTRKQADDELVAKWERYGLLEGDLSDHKKANLARLFENQKEQLRREMIHESTSMASGDVQGFAAVAFPIIRRAFGKLVGAQDLVSVQSLDQPVGLVFVLDFTAGTDKKGMGLELGDSIYGQGRVGVQILSGADLSGVNAEKGPYALNGGYSSPTATSTSISLVGPVRSGTVGGTDYVLDAFVKHDPDLSGSFVAVFSVPKAALHAQLNTNFFGAIVDTYVVPSTSGTLLKRYTQDNLTSTQLFPGVADVILVYSTSMTQFNGAINNGLTSSAHVYKVPITDNYQNVGNSVLGALVGTTVHGFEFDNSTGMNDAIPEIDLKVDAFDIRTETKMLKAKWTAQVSQDLAAYQNMDVEVELTGVLSEAIAMDIDQEVVKDLFEKRTGVRKFWHRRPGVFVREDTGEVLSAGQQGDFTGNVSEWFQTLLITLNNASAVMMRKIVKGGFTWMLCAPETQSTLESTNMWYAATTVGEDSNGSAGVSKAGSFSNKWEVYVTPYFYRNLILIGRKGKGNLETGYVYAPYIPMITSPTIPNPDNLFVYQKGVMTRYGKKMIRPDYFGLVEIIDQ